MITIKLGGSRGMRYDAAAADIASLHGEGHRVLVVHGGSSFTDDLARSLGHEPRKVTSVSGHTSRYTDRQMLDIFLMATARLNRSLVSMLRSSGCNALGLSGLDGGVLTAKRKSMVRIIEDGRQRILRDDWTGRPTSVNTTLLQMLVRSGYLPVLAPVAGSEVSEPLNVDGDRAAALVAARMQCESLIILTNTPGLLRDVDDPASRVARLRADEIESAHEMASAGMRKKLLSVSEALTAGVSRVVLADARVDHPIRRALAGEGTVIENVPGEVQSSHE